MERQWGKKSATKWLSRLLCACLVLGVLSIICTRLGLMGLKAQGVGTCTETEEKSYPGLGRWDDGPDDLYLNWYVCESKQNKSEWEQFGDSWYQVYCGWHRYEGAKQRCASRDSHLVSIGSDEENEFVQRLCGWETCWIGLSERPNTEEWVWTDGVVVGEKPDWRAYTNWNPGEPNNNEGRDENVAFMNLWARLDMPDPHMEAGDCSRNPFTAPIGSGKWHDIPKDTRVQYSVCEKPATSCESGWKTYQGHCYKRICAMYNFWEASDECGTYGAQLVSINSAGENKFVRHMCEVHSCRIGLSEPANSESWQWADGTRIGEKYTWTGYTNWAEGQPDNSGGHDEDSAVMNVHDLYGMFMKTILFQRLVPLYRLWMIAQLCLPVMLLVLTLLSSRCNNACFAQAVCIVAGVSSIGLCAEILIWLATVGKVNGNWPAGSQTLLIFLSGVALVQIVICCCATSKAQELQWATTSLGWNSMGVREVGAPLQPGSNPNTEMGNPPDA